MAKFVSLKGNKYGITVYIAPSASFDEAMEEAVGLFSSSKMFANQKIAVGYEGKLLTDYEKEKLTVAISEAGGFQCICIMDFSLGTEERFKKAVENSIAQEEELKKKTIDDSETVKKYREDIDALLSEVTSLRNKLSERDEAVAALNEQIKSVGFMDLSNIAKFYKGNLRSGFVLNEESSLVILGDVNAGAEVISGGNIIILGTLRGSVRAGANGNKNAFVFALNMDPMQVAIGDIVARSADAESKSEFGRKKKEKESIEPSIAVLKGDYIAIELATKTVLNDINL